MLFVVWGLEMGVLSEGNWRSVVADRMAAWGGEILSRGTWAGVNGFQRVRDVVRAFYHMRYLFLGSVGAEN